MAKYVAHSLEEWNKIFPKFIDDVLEEERQRKAGLLPPLDDTPSDNIESAKKPRKRGTPPGVDGSGQISPGLVVNRSSPERLVKSAAMGSDGETSDTGKQAKEEDIGNQSKKTQMPNNTELDKAVQRAKNSP